jgi:heme A synthase
MRHRLVALALATALVPTGACASSQAVRRRKARTVAAATVGVVALVAALTAFGTVIALERRCEDRYGARCSGP